MQGHAIVSFGCCYFVLIHVGIQECWIHDRYQPICTIKSKTDSVSCQHSSPLDWHHCVQLVGLHFLDFSGWGQSCLDSKKNFSDIFGGCVWVRVHVIDSSLETGDHRPLSSCTTKAEPKVCRSDFPLHNEMTEVPKHR